MKVNKKVSINMVSHKIYSSMIQYGQGSNKLKLNGSLVDLT